MLDLGIDLLAIQERAWIERYFYTFLYVRFDRVTLELLSLLWTFENSAECSKLLIDFNFFRIAKRSFGFHDSLANVDQSINIHLF